MKEIFDKALSYINDENAAFTAPDDLIKSGKDYLKANPLPAKTEDLSPEQATIFSFLHNEFIKSNPVIENHECWHSQNGVGGTQGVGSGEKFVSFHRDMIKDLANFIDQPVSSMPVSEIVSADIEKIANLFPLPTNVTLDPSPNRTDSTPSYLTAEGGSESFSLDGREIKSLNDLNSIDDFGRVLGESGYHGSAHGALGGTMRGVESPRAAVFYSWHGHLDKLADKFLKAEKGQSWLQSGNNSNWEKNTTLSNSTSLSAICTPPSIENEKDTSKVITGGTAGGAALLLGMAAALYVKKKNVFKRCTPRKYDTKY